MQVIHLLKERQNQTLTFINHLNLIFYLFSRKSVHAELDYLSVENFNIFKYISLIEVIFPTF